MTRICISDETCSDLRVAGKGAPSQLLLYLSLLAALSLAPGQSALAQDVPGGTNLNNLAPPTNGTSWNLLGNVVLYGGGVSTALPLPVGAPGLTITGNGNTVTLNDGAGHYGYFSGSGATTFNLANITIAGGSRAGAGGAMTSAGALTLNTSGNVTLTDNHTTATNASGGAIASGGLLTITGDHTAFAITSGSAGQYGGAVSAVGAVMSGSYNSVLIDGNASGTGFNGSAFYIQGALNINANIAGDFTVSNNTAGSNGAIWASQGVVVASTTAVGGTLAFTGNRDLGAGAAIYTDAGIAIGGTYGNILLDDNRGFGGRGGAFRAASGITIDTTVNGKLTISNNSDGSDGGALAATAGSVNITGNYNGGIDFHNNSAGTNAGADASFHGGGAVYANGNVTISNSSGTLAMTNNIINGSNSAATINGGAIYSVGMTSLNGSAITLIGNSVNSTITASSGGAIYSGGTTTLTGNTLTLMNNSVDSVLTANGGAISSGGMTTLTGGNITLSGNQAKNNGGGINVLAGGITINGNLVANSNTAGQSGGALYAQAGDITLTGGASMASTVLTGNSAGGDGGAIYSGGAVTLTGTTIGNNTASGAGGAVYAIGDFSLSATTNDQISNNSAGTEGGAFWAGGNATLDAAAGSISFSGNKANGLANAMYLNNTAGNTTTTFNVAAGQGITFFDPIQNNAANGLVTVLKTGTGTLAFDGSQYSNAADHWSQVYGNTTVQSGTLEVSNQAVYGMTSAQAGEAAPTSFSVDAGAILAGGLAGTVNADAFTLYGNLNIAGAQSATRGIFTINSNNVTFGAGSQVLFNTYLNDGSVQNTDLLVLNLNGGATSGQASIVVTNPGGPGGVTVGNGIKLVEADNGSTTGAFVLGNPELRAGAYNYRLFQGGIDGGDSSSWFLRSTFEAPPITPEEPTEPPEPPEPPEEPPPSGILPPDPPPAVLPPDTTWPIIGPEVATYGVVQPMVRQMGLTALDTLHERIGDSLTPAAGLEASPGWWNPPSSWGRIIGQQVDNRYRAFTSPEVKGHVSGFQLGVDLWRNPQAAGSSGDAVGVYFAYLNSRGNVNGLVTNAAATAYETAPTGTVRLNGYSGGAYWTHYGAGGWYTDAVFQGTHYTGNATTAYAYLPVSGTGLLTSLESGYPIALPLGPNFILEPQAQLVWQRANLGSANDGLGEVDLGTTSGVSARLGLRGQWTIASTSGKVWQPYVRTNVWRDWGAQAMTTFSGLTGAALQQQVTRMDGAAGFTAMLDPYHHIGIYGQVGYRFTLSASANGRQQGFWGSAGVRLSW